MNLLKRIWQSSLGKKYIMAGTGVCLLLFVLGHMVGNLQVFEGPDAINAYAHFLQSNRHVLWTVRSILLVIVGLHILSAIKLSLENKAARPIAYQQQELVAASYASRTMLMSGLIIAAFVVYHLLHYTAQVRAINLTGQQFTQFVDAHGHHDVFKMMVVGFSQPVVSAFYIFAILLLCLHLRHGIASMAQSLGVTRAGNRGFFEGLAWTLATIFFLGYSSIPIAILCGYGKEVLHQL